MEKIHIREGSYIAKRAARRLKSKDVAIVIWNTIFIFGVDRETFIADKRWLRHEIEHTKQWKANGFFLYILRYLYYSIRYSYYDNPYEAEARAAETDLAELEHYRIVEDTLYRRGTGLRAGISSYTRWYDTISVGICLILFILIFTKSSHIPVTHDESRQILFYARQSLYDIFMYTNPWPTNHILNSVLIKLFTAILGDHQWVERLPNNLAFILFYIYTLKWSRKFFQKNYWGLFVTIALLCLVPFQFDFFSTARGYGLALSFQLMATYHLYQYLYTLDSRQHVTAQVALLLMVLSNFSWLLLWALIEAIIFLFSFARRRSRDFLVAVGASLVILGVSIVPILRMTSTDQFKYWQSNGLFQDTFQPLVHFYFYEGKFVTIDATTIFALFVLLSIVICVYAYLFRSRDILWLFPAMYFGMMLAGILQNKLMDTPYLTGRTALMYYPMMGLMLLAYLRIIFENKRSFQISSITLTIFGVLLFTLNYAKDYVLEWKYDRYTFEVLDMLEQEHEKGVEALHLGTHWLFYPSLDYHIQQRAYDWMDLTEFRYEPIADSTQYFYTISTERSEADSLGFTDLHHWDGDQVLLRRATYLLEE